LLGGFGKERHPVARLQKKRRETTELGFHRRSAQDSRQSPPSFFGERVKRLLNPVSCQSAAHSHLEDDRVITGVRLVSQLLCPAVVGVRQVGSGAADDHHFGRVTLGALSCTDDARRLGNRVEKVGSLARPGADFPDCPLERQPVTRRPDDPTRPLAVLVERDLVVYADGAHKRLEASPKRLDFV